MFSMTPSFSSSEKASLTDMSLSELKVLLNAQWKKNLGATMARKNKVNKCVSKFVAHDKHRSDIRHQMRVTWMVRLTTTSGICEEVYFRADVALEADFEARVDWVLVPETKPRRARGSPSSGRVIIKRQRHTPTRFR